MMGRFAHELLCLSGGAPRQLLPLAGEPILRTPPPLRGRLGGGDNIMLRTPRHYTFTQRIPYYLSHRFSIPQNVAVPKPQHVKPLSFQRRMLSLHHTHRARCAVPRQLPLPSVSPGTRSPQYTGRQDVACETYVPQVAANGDAATRYARLPSCSFVVLWLLICSFPPILTFPPHAGGKEAVGDLAPYLRRKEMKVAFSQSGGKEFA